MGSELPFSRRIARENGWSTDYTWRVIEEYKCFAFLATVAGHPVTPSDAVDQVWHVHLTYSRSYWEDFCPNVFGKALHHEPTRGGGPNNQIVTEWYQQTLDRYERLLGHPAPSDIWPDPAIRFGEAQHFVRINKACYWLILKPKGVLLGGSTTLATSSLVLLDQKFQQTQIPVDPGASGIAGCGCGGCGGGCGGWVAEAISTTDLIPLG